MTIEHFRNTLTLELGQPGPVAVPLGEPVAQVATQGVERADGVEAGVWECSPGRWRRQVMQKEFCHFIQGRCTFTPDEGEPIEIQAGDALMFPANTTGIWDVQETVRKSYVIIS
jgi:uncharacterized cupin superfamily protein